MSSSYSVTGAALLVVLLTAWPVPAAEEADKHPNIVLFVSDDMGWNDVGYHGSRAETPNIDRLAKEGVQLERFYVHPICSPTRVALMTARSPLRFGITRPIGGSGGVPLDESFLPQAFRAAGYQTFMVGKWHLGAMSEGDGPQTRGFDHFYGFRGGAIDYYTHSGGRQLDWQRNGKTLEEEGYSTDLFAKEAVNLLKQRDKTKPVFLYVPFNAPHGPPQAPDDLVAKYEKLGVDRRAAARIGSIDSMDRAIGKILAALEEEKMAGDTLVMFFCDNGAPGGRGGRGPRRQQPEAPQEDREPTFRGGKGSVLEGGIRVPAVMRWPGVIKPGTTSEQLVSAQDLLPTLATAAGIPHGSKKPLDGIDLWKELRDGKTSSRKPVVIGGGSGVTVLQDQWKLIHSAGELELYDVRKDPFEGSEIAGDHPKVVAKLKAILDPFVAMVAKNGGEERPRGRRPRGRRPAPGGEGGAGEDGRRPPRRGPGGEGARPQGPGRPDGARPPRPAEPEDAPK